MSVKLIPGTVEGEIRTGPEIGYKSFARYQWVRCKECGKLHWVQMVLHRAKTDYCRACSLKRQKNHSLSRFWY